MKVKGISIFESLLTEAELATLSNTAQDVVAAGSSDWVEQMDRFLDALIDEETQRLSKILSLTEMSPGMAIFLDEGTVRNVLSYVKFTKSRLDRSIREFKHLAGIIGDRDRLKTTQIARDIILHSSRLHTLNLIYKKIKDLAKAAGKDPYSNNTLKGLLDELNVKQTDVDNSLVVMAKDSAEAVTPSFVGISQKGDDNLIYVTQKAAAIAIGLDKTAETINDEEPKRKTKFYSNSIFDNYVKNGGSGEFFKKQYYSLKDLDYHYLDITERIEKLRKWDDESTFDAEVKKIITSITSTGKVFSDTVVKHLTKRLAEAIAEARERMSLKKTNLKNINGSRYVFEVRLPLYRSVQLPVTAKQIADQSFLKKAGNMLTKFGSLLPDMVDSKWDLANRQLGDSIRGLIAPAAKHVAGKIGHTVGGKEGERKGHAAVHSVFKDKYLKENEGAPGLAMQTPGSISNAGPIVAPTPTSYGSGDKFSPDKQIKKYKTRKKKRG